MKNGCSNCQPGQEITTTYFSNILKKRLIAYEYRHPSGKLFTTISPNVVEAKRRRDAWLKANGLTM